MKRLITALIISAITVGVAAQEGESALGLQFGFAQTDFRTNSWNPEDDAKELNNLALNGFKVGFVWDATFIKGFGSMVGLNYTFGTHDTGWQQEFELSKYPQIKEQSFYHQLELFVDWQYKFQIAGNTYIILYTGPTIQAHLSLTTKEFERTITNQNSTSKDINRYDYNDEQLHTDYKRFNVTWGIGVGFQYDRYYIRGGYDFGLVNPFKIGDFNEAFGNIYGENKDSGRATRGRTDQWSIKIGVFFAQFDK